MSRSRLQNAKLYGIVDLGYVIARDLIRVTAEMLEGGIDVIQLRAKGHAEQEVENWAEMLLPVCREAQVPMLINDFPRIASRIGADGVHLGQDDGETHVVREQVGAEMLIGRSTHSREQADAAAADAGIDYIGFGPIFATPTKPGRPAIGMTEIAEVNVKHPDLPIFCIGGIKLENLASLVEFGAKRVVIVSGILQSGDIAAYVRSARALMP